MNNKPSSVGKIIKKALMLSLPASFFGAIITLIIILIFNGHNISNVWKNWFIAFIIFIVVFLIMFLYVFIQEFFLVRNEYNQEQLSQKAQRQQIVDALIENDEISEMSTTKEISTNKNNTSKTEKKDEPKKIKLTEKKKNNPKKNIKASK